MSQLDPKTVKAGIAEGVKSYLDQCTYSVANHPIRAIHAAVEAATTAWLNAHKDEVLRAIAAAAKQSSS